MSVHRSGESEMYWNDLFHQQVQFDGSTNDGDGTPAVNQEFAQIGVEPLADTGGLNQNELAELVAYRLVGSVSTEGSADVADYSTFPNTLQYRGVLGANLDPNNLTNGPDDDITAGPADGTQFVAFSEDHAEVWQDFMMQYEVPFIDTGNGIGGGGSVHTSGMGLTHLIEDLGVRGPFIDATDDIGVAVAQIAELASEIDVKPEPTVVADLYWDTHTVEGRRSDFDPPGR